MSIDSLVLSELRELNDQLLTAHVNTWEKEGKHDTDDLVLRDLDLADPVQCFTQLQQTIGTNGTPVMKRELTGLMRILLTIPVEKQVGDSLWSAVHKAVAKLVLAQDQAPEANLLKPQ